MKNYLTHKGYYGSVEFSAEDKTLYGQILGISDLISYEAESVDALETVFKEVVEDYLQQVKI